MGRLEGYLMPLESPEGFSVGACVNAVAALLLGVSLINVCGETGYENEYGNCEYD